MVSTGLKNVNGETFKPTAVEAIRLKKGGHSATTASLSMATASLRKKVREDRNKAFVSSALLRKGIWSSRFTTA
jgi:hypothetical protein